MITGLQITISGDELSRRIAERIEVHKATIATFNTRISQREGDAPFDVRPEDDFKTLGELESERQQFLDRVTQLTLLRDNIVAGELYVLSKADLRVAELISGDHADASATSDAAWIHDRKYPAIDGLKLTVRGDEIRRLLEERASCHARRAERWKHEQARTPDEQTEDQPLLPDHMCENEAERHDWRAEVLTFIRDHIDATEVYRLGEADLEFGELLPEKPGWKEQQEYEERTGVAFNLERLTKRVGELMAREFSFGQLQGESK